jgi:carboxyl-terminal processing protease
MRVLIPLAVAVFMSSAQPSQPAQIAFQAAQDDIDALWQHIADNYAYFDRKSSVWSSVPALYDAERQRVRTLADLVALLERMVEELYDHHAHLTTNTPESRRLVPSGADIWAIWLNGRATVAEVRADSDARRADIRAGDDISSIGGIPIDRAVAAQLPRSPSPDDAATSRG